MQGIEEGSGPERRRKRSVAARQRPRSTCWMTFKIGLFVRQISIPPPVDPAARRRRQPQIQLRRPRALDAVLSGRSKLRVEVELAKSRAVLGSVSSIQNSRHCTTLPSFPQNAGRYCLSQTRRLYKARAAGRTLFPAALHVKMGWPWKSLKNYRPTGKKRALFMNDRQRDYFSRQAAGVEGRDPAGNRGSRCRRCRKRTSTTPDLADRASSENRPRHRNWRGPATASAS